MAFWTIRKSTQVIVYTFEGGKQRQIPRALTRHLDGQAETAIAAWVTAWEAQHERDRHAPPRLSDERLAQLLQDFLEHASSPAALKRRDGSTVLGYRVSLANHVFPYFLENGLTDVALWPNKCAVMAEDLRAKGLPDPTILKCCSALSRFWEWLQRRQVVPAGTKLNIPRPAAPEKDTPLKRTVSPEEALAAARKLPEDLELVLLVGYFFSLRTQEVFGLRKGDFAGGDKAEALECCKVMTKAGQFNRLAVFVSRQVSKSTGKVTTPKTSGSRAWVACFNREAASRIAALVNARCPTPDAPLFKYKTDWYMKKWRDGGLRGVTIKDLRRASLYWLGHDSGLNTVQLKNHARHVDLNTTSRYVRRPEDLLQGNDGDLAI